VSAQVNVVDLFAGAGGWEQGAVMLGLRHVIGIEIDPVFAATASAAGHFRLVADVSALDPRIFAPTDGLLASPPCQGFSAAGNGVGRGDLPLILDAVRMMGAGVDDRDRLRSLCTDRRSELVVEPLRWALTLRPQWLAWEQVPSVLPVWQACATVLRSLGYSTWTGNLRTEAYGVPQTRTRAVLIASLVREVGEPRRTHSRYYPRDPSRVDLGMPRPVSMATVLGWGASLRPSPTVTGGGTATGGAEPIAHLSRYINRPNWVLRPNARGNATVRLADQPAATITGGKDFRERRWMLAGEDQAHSGRRVTVEEAGVLQGFPADYPWRGNLGQRYQQVGNAVPPPLSRAVIAEALGHLGS
jgi:DNA (cytosine-5)-methyltransferase 1